MLDIRCCAACPLSDSALRESALLAHARPVELKPRAFALQVLLGKQYNEKADIFALGMIMFELFSNNLRLLQVCVQRNHQTTIMKYAHRVARGSRPTIPK